MAEHLNNEDLDSLSSNDLSSSEMLISPTVTLRTASVPKIYKEENVLPSDRRCSSKLRILVILLVVLSTVMAICLVVVIMRCRKSSFNKQKRSVENVKRFFQLSDTHFDLYYDANLTNKHSSFCRDKPLIGANSTTPADTSAMYGRVKCDSPITLLHSLAEELQNVNNELEESVHFVLITGDQSAHAYSNFQLNATEATIWSIGNSTKVIGEALKDVPIFPLLGNNDLLLDYDPPIVNHSYLYQTLRNIWEPYIFRANVDQFNTRKDFQQTFEYGGYYKVDTDGK